MSVILERGPKNEEELWYLTQALWGHKIPRVKVCPDHDAPFDAFATAYFSREPQILIHGSRGLSGKSRTLSILGLTKAAVLGSDVNILGGSLNQSNNIHETMRDAWEYKYAPTYMVKDSSMTSVRLSNGAHIRPLTASQKTVRGPHPPTLLLDEIDEMDQLILDAALGQPMPQTNWQGENIAPQTTMSSTWQYPDKTFAEMYRRHQEQELPIYTWCIAGTITGVITRRGEVKIEEVTVDDHVLTREGFKQVQHVTYMGEKQCVKVITSDGREVVCTPDHKVLTTERGWIEVAFLRPTDSLLVLHAGPTVSSSIGTDVEVGTAVGVPLGADLSGDLIEHATGQLAVLAPSHLPQMVGVAAAPVVAGVVQGGSGDRSDLPQVDQSMDDLLTPLVATGDDSVPSGVGASLPDPASLLVADDAALQPVVVDDQTLGDVSAGTASGGLPVDLLPTVETVHVVSVIPEEVRATYDIGVEGMHEFTANGVVVHNCYRETSNPIDGWLDPDFIEEKRRQIPAEMWRVEYELGEPSIGNRAFDSEKVEAMFSIKPEEVVIAQKVSKDYQEYKFAEYQIDREYVIAADWAKAQDFTVITVYDATEFPVSVAYWIKMRRRPYPVMIDQYNKLMQTYNAQGIHDATGLGGVVSDYLDSRARGFLMTGAQRDNMLSEYISAVENDRFRVPRVTDFYKSHLYCSVEDVYSRGKEFHLPDEVCSMALGWKLISRRAPAVTPIVFGKTDDANWMEAEMRNNKDSNREPSGWDVGGVRNKTQEAEQEFSLMV